MSIDFMYGILPDDFGGLEIVENNNCVDYIASAGVCFTPHGSMVVVMSISILKKGGKKDTALS